MKQSNRFVFFFLAVPVLLFGSLSAQAQENPAKVVEDSLNAIGRQANRAKVRSIHGIADCTGPRGPYTTEIYSASNGRLIFKQVRAGSAYQGTTNGDTYWTSDAKTGDFELADRRAAFAWRSHDFQTLALEVASRFRKLEFTGYESVSQRDAIKLSGRDELDHPVSVYFDRESKLMLGFVIQDPFSDEPRTIRTTFNEWKTVGSLRLPSKVTATDHQGDFVLSFRELILNKVDERVFAVPPQVIALNELMELHRQSRAAHFQRDAKLLVGSFADGFTNIGNGKIQTPTREASLDRFTNYFSNSTFLEWDDVVPPMIQVSNDATMGYAIVNKRVRLKTRDAAGGEVESTEVFAWLATYRKINGQWKLTVLASTNTPEADK